MFCTSLRRRSSFAAAIPTLTSLPLKLRESQLGTHDMEFLFGNGLQSVRSNALSRRQLRALLLSRSSASDANLHHTLERIRHFASLTGGEDLLIVFLLNPPTDSNFISAKIPSVNSSNDVAQGDAIAAYMKIQAELASQPEIPHITTLPICKHDDLLETLQKHISMLLREPQKPALPDGSFRLLPLCTANTSATMAKQTAYVLSDLFTGLKDLATECSSVSSAPNSSSPSARAAPNNVISSGYFTVDESTQDSGPGITNRLKQLRDLVGDQECRDVVDFWKEEWAL